MYAVIKTGGKQYRVSEGQTLKIEKVEVDAGASLRFDEVLMVARDDQILVGAPHLAGGCVTATVKGHGRGRKIKIVKFRRRKHHRKQQGHRQAFTEVQITGISTDAPDQ